MTSKDKKRIRFNAANRRRYMAVKVGHTQTISKPDKVMFAESEFYSGEAVWKFELGAWHCVEANECLKFLLKKDVPDAKLDLIRRGFTWRWL
jgi:hypothetical protein